MKYLPPGNNSRSWDRGAWCGCAVTDYYWMHAKSAAPLRRDPDVEVPAFEVFHFEHVLYQTRRTAICALPVCRLKRTRISKFVELRVCEKSPRQQASIRRNMTREFGRRLPPKFTREATSSQRRSMVNDQFETTKSSFASVPLRRPLPNAIGQPALLFVVPARRADIANWVLWSAATPQAPLHMCCEYQ